jgi:hypothetical protein
MGLASSIPRFVTGMKIQPTCHRLSSGLTG